MTELETSNALMTPETLRAARAKLNEVVTFEDGRETIRGSVEGQEYVLKPPVLYRRQIIPNFEQEQLQTLTDGVRRGLDMRRKSYIFCYSGIRGSNKTKSLTFSAIFAMTVGLNCYTNYPIEFILVEDSGEHKRYKPPVVTVGEMIDSLDKWKRSFICGDEWQDVVGKYDYSTTKSKLVNGRVARIRKAKSSMGYTSKFVDWVTTRTRDELDIDFACEDAANTLWGYGRFGDGDKAIWTVRDFSGVWSGKKYNEKRPVTYQYLVYLKPINGSYDTDFSVDILESMRGVEVDLQKKRITDKEQKAAMDPAMLRGKLISIYEKQTHYNKSVLWNQLGIDPVRDSNNRNTVFQLMAELGIQQSKNGYYRDAMTATS